ncbi:hypothetical protein CcCBS67573_g00587 [Chytriomyces confervae]|uniref:NAD(P)-binding protein n=1 Tax=Chytriomyces confervae TaxID=246404 RepID=A0A507FSD0_9FUNG|nr:hypothetical protein HDU80_008657 [Chytriomyces hyalinus]TPX78116.1 hypothetical protein CcCBS67573_g00587 [Chytriomyces confervae]
MSPNPHSFSAASIPDLTGRVFVVTGGNTGIGYETCLQLAKKNATIVMASRSEERAAGAIEKIKASTGNDKIEFLKLVLNDLNQVSSAAKELTARHTKIDVLVNNAGIMASPFALSVDGIEDQFATNHVGHFLFTREVLPALLQGDQPRIVNLSSSAHTFAPKPEGIRFQSINVEGSMGTWERYGQSKLSNILFSKKLNKLYGDKIIVNSVHPGVVDTELMRGPAATYGTWVRPFLGMFKALATISPQDGALTQLFCATSPIIQEKGLKDRFFEPTASDVTDTSKLSAFGKDDALADKLWEFTEALLKEKGF